MSKINSFIENELPKETKAALDYLLAKGDPGLLANLVSHLDEDLIAVLHAQAKKAEEHAQAIADANHYRASYRESAAMGIMIAVCSGVLGYFFSVEVVQWLLSFYSPRLLGTSVSTLVGLAFLNTYDAARWRIRLYRWLGIRRDAIADILGEENVVRLPSQEVLTTVEEQVCPI